MNSKACGKLPQSLGAKAGAAIGEDRFWRIGKQGSKGLDVRRVIFPGTTGK
jgi:hypothetical protein